MKKSNVNKKILFGILMVVIYLAMGYMVAFSRIFSINRTLGTIIGLLMMLYGVFRAIRLYREQ